MLNTHCVLFWLATEEFKLVSSTSMVVNKVQEIKCVIFMNELLMTNLSQIFSVLPSCCENTSCTTCTIGSDIAAQHGAHAIDFKGEAMTFKATTAGVLATLQHCLELVGQREDTWRRRLEREVERRRKIEEMYRTARQEAATHRLALHGSPDYEVGCFVGVGEVQVWFNPRPLPYKDLQHITETSDFHTLLKF
jgi:hypothetical protein